MKKLRIRDRLYLLNGGRAPYLEFLRNLTPQIVLLTVTFLYGKNLEFSRIDLSNFVPTFVWLVFFGAFMLAFYVNAARFYEHCFGNWKAWRTRLEKRLTARGILGYRRRLAAKMRATWHFRFVEFVEILLVFYFFIFALSAVVVMSYFSAAGMLRNIHAG